MTCIQKIFVGTILGWATAGLDAWADTIVLNQNFFSYMQGGEFNAVTGQPLFLDNYAPVAVFGDGFQTFCVQSGVIFNPGQTYTYNLSDQDSRGRDLTEGAAFLYDEFAKGTLPGYDYTDASVRTIDAGQLQTAFWWLQGNPTLSSYPNPTNNPYYQYATNQLGLAAAESPNNGRYDVDILQLWDGGVSAQNQLVLLPDTVDTLSALALGLAALAAGKLRRRPAPF